jgi:hypothetical protein
MLTHGWVTLDEGAIGLSARMTAAGYMPHRDFAYPYTGALAAWNALGVEWFGPSMMVARWQMFVAFLAWLPAVWMLTRQVATPTAAAATVVLAAWWSLLVYPAAMPTWYLLFCSTWSLVALAHWARTGGRRWLLGAGALAGGTICVKQTGVYVLVATGLAVLAIEQARGEQRRGMTAVVVRVLLGVAALVPALIVVRRGVLSGDAWVLALPVLAVLVGLGVRATRTPVAIWRDWGTVLAGAAIPMAGLIGWYAYHGAATDLWRGAVLGGAQTAATIDRPLPDALRMLGLALPVIAVAIAIDRIGAATTRAVVAIAAAIATCVFAMQWVPAYHAVWYAAQLAMAGAVVTTALAHARGSRSWLTASAGAFAALMALNAFPYAAPNYFAYAAPLGVLVVAMLAAARPRAPLFACALALVFGGWFHRIGGVGTVGEGLRVPAADSARYARLGSLIDAHGGPEAFIAGPEMPELYVLAGTKRLVAQPYLLTTGRRPGAGELEVAIDTSRVRAVVLNDSPKFLPALGAEALAWLRDRYPNAERVDGFEFRWR